MPRISDCDHCYYFANDHHLVCAVHPTEPVGDRCPDFSPDPELKGKRFVDFLRIFEDSEPNEAQWEPIGARYVGSELVIECDLSFYGGKEIVQPRHRRTRAEQLWLLDNHPIFTGHCPNCNAAFEIGYRAVVHWDCSCCGWIDDSV